MEASEEAEAEASVEAEAEASAEAEAEASVEIEDLEAAVVEVVAEASIYPKMIELLKKELSKNFKELKFHCDFDKF